MSNLTVEGVISKYIQNRDLIAAKQKALDEELADLKALQKRCEKWLQAKMDEIGATSLKAKGVGICFMKRTESVKVSDWDKVLDYVRETGQWELLTKGVSKTVALEQMGENRDKVLPPGLDYVAIAAVGIQRG